MSDYKVLVEVSKIFDAIAKDKAEVARNKEEIDNGIITYPEVNVTPTTQSPIPASPPRVETVPLPRVIPTEPSNVAVLPQLVVAYPSDVVAMSDKKDLHQPPPIILVRTRNRLKSGP